MEEVNKLHKMVAGHEIVKKQSLISLCYKSFTDKPSTRAWTWLL